jgi:regulator of protease activity HflC (stomatin/prohibitin superfamily)
VARSRDLLQRFRPAGAPGTAAAAGVPADRVAELSAELEPVLALLDEATREAVRIRAEGSREAARLRAAADRRARTTVAAATREAEGDRLAAAARVNDRAAAEAAKTLAAARLEAAALHRRADEHLQEYADRVLAEVRSTVLGDAP